MSPRRLVLFRTRCRARMSAGGFAVAAVAIAACRSGQASSGPATLRATGETAVSSSSSHRSHASIQSLEETVDALRMQFNADKGKLRFIALLSPT